MKIVIVGDGKVGYTLLEQLVKEGHDITVIDNNLKTLENSINKLDVIGIYGNGASYNVLLEAGVNKADLIIAATSADEINMLCCFVAKKLGAKATIARIRNPEYNEQLIFMKEELGLSMAINPELEAANEISRIIGFPSAMKIDSFAKGKVELVEFKITPDNPFVGMPLSAISNKYKFKFLVCAVQRNEQVFIPTGSFVIEEGDRISITSSRSNITMLFKNLGILKNKIKTVMIAGGGRTSYYLAKQLTDIGIKVKIIELDTKRCEYLVDNLNKVMIINGDGTDQDLLHEEGIQDMDAFVALTDRDEENIAMSMYAGLQKVSKIITKVNKINFVEILDNINVGIDSVISPKHITANKILQYVRSMQNTVGSNVVTLHRIVNNKVEALEFLAGNTTSFLEIPLRRLTLKKNLLIACIIRNGKVIIPGGNDTVERGDSLIVVTTNSGLRDINDILE